MISRFPSLLGVAALAYAGGAAAATFPPDQVEFFEKNVRPLLAEHCTDCHGPTKHENGLRLDVQAAVTHGGDYGKIVEPGNPAASKLIKAVKHLPGVEAMPKKGAPLSSDQIAVLEKWITMGAPWPDDKVATAEKPKWEDHWAFKKITKPAVPLKTGTGNPIDALVQKKLTAAGLKPAPPAPAAALCRRLYLDVTGLLPTYEQVEAFQKAYQRDARSAVRSLVDTLLSSPHYGERWARYWLDVARYSDTEGYQVAGRDIRYPYAYTYRDWVVKSLNADMPYDQFVKLQLAADKMVPEGGPDLAALGFLTVNDTFIGNRDLQTDDRIDVTARGLLGLSVGCARCHNHKYDPIPSKDYYALYSVFNSSQVPDELPVIGKPASELAYASFKEEIGKVEAKRTAYRKEVFDDIRKPDRITSYLSFVHEVHVKKLENEAYRGRAGQLQLRDKVAKKWETLVSQTATTHPVMLAWSEFAKLSEAEFAAKAPEVIQRLGAPGGKCPPQVLQAFTTRPPLKTFNDVAAAYADLFSKHLNPPPAGQKDVIHEMLMRPASPMSVAMESMDTLFTRKDLESVVQLSNQMKRIEIMNEGAPPRAMVMNDRPTPSDVRVFIRGNPARQGDLAPRGNLTLLGGQKFTQGSGRLELANAIANRDNPLTARVMVNRVWLQHFGRPLVANPSDFGVQTSAPEQLDLLNYLAASFMEQGWSLKNLHRLILTSATYQQSSQTTPEKETKDAENALLSRFNRTRLDYEAMRDAVAKVAGVLNEGQMGGRPVALTAPTVDSARTVYHFVDRYDQATVPAMFDFANPDQHSAQRFVTTVPQQALFLMNSPFMQRQSGALSSRLPVQGSTPDSETIKALYHRVLLRDPQPDEVELAQRFLNDAAELQKLAAFRWTYGTERLQRDAAGKVTLTDWKPFGVLKEQHKRPTWSHTGTVPDPEWRYAMIYENGGHAPKDDFVVTMRWEAPEDMTIRITSQLKRDNDRGNGVRGLIVSSRTGLVAEALAWPKQKIAPLGVESLEVKKGDVLHFSVSPEEGNTDSDTYEWTPEISRINADATVELLTNSRTDFCGKDQWPLNRAKPQSSLSQLAQALIMSNEFMFVD